MDIYHKKGALLSTFFYYVLLTILLIYNVFYPILANDTQLESQYAKGFYYSQQGEHHKAFQIMHTLALKGHSQAKHNLALSYIHGLGVSKDKIKAEYWLRAAHADNVIDATVELAHILFDKGERQTAISLWQQAAIHNDEYALFNLAMVAFEQGNTFAAKHYLIQAQQFNHPQAQEYLQRYFIPNTKNNDTNDKK